MLQNSPETPSRDIRLAAIVTAIDLILKAQDTVTVIQVKTGAVVEVLDAELKLLRSRMLNTGILDLARRKFALEGSLVAIVATASIFHVLTGGIAILPDVAGGVTPG